MAELLINDREEFTRRVGFRLLFGLINDEYIDKIFELMLFCEHEDKYYVNMIIAWLIAECFVKQRNKTLDFLKIYKNRFAVNKAISKCYDSFRVSNEDKSMLKQFRLN